MKSCIAVLAFLLVPLAAPRAQSAEESERPERGTRIRVTMPTGAPAREGVLLEWQAGGALVLPKGSGDPILIPSDRLGGVEVFTGTRSNVAAGAVIGAIGGFASGAGVMLLLSGEEYVGSEINTGDVLSVGAWAAVFGAGFGALWGAVTGKPTWAPIQAGAVQVRPVLVTRHFGLSLRASF